MTEEQTSKLLDAVEAAGINSYEFTSDIDTHLYHDGVRHLIKVKGDMIYGIRSAKNGGSHNTFSANVQVVGMWCEDAHEFRTAGNYQQIKTFMDELGVELSADEFKVVLALDKMNSDIIPVTGDYNNFVPLSDEEYAKLTPEGKEAYDAKKAEYEDHKKNYIGQNMALGVRLGRDWS